MAITVYDKDLNPQTIETLPSVGSKAAASSLPMTASTEDVARIGIVTETAPANDTASSGLNGRLQRVAQNITSLIAKLPTALGSTSASGSLGVTASTEDVARVGSVTETAPASDTASSGLNGRLQRIAQRLTSLIALVPASLGAKAASASFAVTHSTEDAAQLGSLTETAPASDTASSGLNGRLQRIAQRLTSMIALLPTSLATGGGLRVTLQDTSGTAVDQTATINIAHDSNAMKLGNTSVTPKFATIAASSSGNNTLIAAVASKKIRVLAYNFIGNGAVNAKFQSGAGGTDLTGLKYIAAAGGGICAPFNPVGWFETASNTLLNLNLSGAVAVGGEVVYIEV